MKNKIGLSIQKNGYKMNVWLHIYCLPEMVKFLKEFTETEIFNHLLAKSLSEAFPAEEEDKKKIS